MEKSSLSTEEWAKQVYYKSVEDSKKVQKRYHLKETERIRLQQCFVHYYHDIMKIEKEKEIDFVFIKEDSLELEQFLRKYEDIEILKKLKKSYEIIIKGYNTVILDYDLLIEEAVFNSSEIDKCIHNKKTLEKKLNKVNKKIKKLDGLIA
jgi:uncharacterized membrane protein